MGGSLWGHLDEGLAFIFLGVWWMYNVLKGYIQAGVAAKYKTEVSYTASLCGNTFNWEVYAKIIVSIAGFLIEVFNKGSHVSVLNEDGEFDPDRIPSLQHMSIYTLFILHGVIDLLRYKKVLVIEGLEYFTISMAFAWYGMIFYFHTQSGHSDKLETVVHTLGLIWCLGAALSILWECRTVDKFLPNYCRSLMVICLGTWFFHMPFYLYSTHSFPGEDPNPAWDRNDMRNAQFLATMFGFHLMFNMALSLGLFALIKLIYRGRDIGGYRAKFQLLNQDNAEYDDKEALLDEEL